MGTVYVAEQAIIGRKVALKVLRRDLVQDESAVKRFLNEAKAIAALKSPNTITLHDFGVTEDGLLYYTMELLEGRPLSKVISQHGPLAVDVAAEIVLQTLESLEEAHEHEILHRDLKPENLFISERRGKRHVTVLDFGIAKLRGDSTIESITRTGMICGTPAYLAPEQALGNPASPASDLYSLGIVFYEMLAGFPPFQETAPMKILLKHLNEHPAPIHVKNPAVEVPAAIEAFLQKTLEKQPEKRFPSAPAFRKALAAAIETHKLSPQTAQLPPLKTTSDGLRVITHPHIPLAEARGELQPVEADGPTILAESVAGITADNLAPRPQGAVVSSSPGTTAIDVPGVRAGRRFGLYAGIAAALVVAVALAVWRPWIGSQPPTAGGSEPAKQDSAAAPAAAAATDKQAELEARLKTEAEARAKAEAEARLRAEEQSAMKAELEAGRKEQQEARLKAEAEAKQAADELARLKAEAEAKKRAEEEAKAKAEAEAKKRAEEEAMARAEAEAAAAAKAKADEGARVKAHAEAEAEAKKTAAGKKPEAGEKPDSGFGFRNVSIDDGKAADKKAADKKPADEKGADKKAADEKGADKKAADKKAADKKAADKKAADKKAADEKGADKKPEDSGFGFRPVDLQEK
jgi:serine/threonine protein kinase